MDFFKKGMIRHAFSFSLLSLILTLLLIETAAAAQYRDDIPVPFSQIVWDHPNISGWPITSDLSKVYISGGQINMPHTKACSWPLADAVVNANAWVIHRRPADGRWHANTWDFMRQCQTSKGEHDVGAPDGWRPSSGEEVYFFISGIARPGYEHLANVSERTNIVKYYWHGATGYALPALPTCVGPPVINSFTANPNPVVIGVAGLLGDSPYNVALSWNVTNGDRVRLVADTGESAETTSHGPVINGLDLYLPTTHTFTLYGINECTPESQWPKRTITVKAKLPGLPWLQGLILYASADVTTFSAVLDPIGSKETMRGSVNSKMKEASASFQYGLNTNYGKEVPAQPGTITGGNDTPISAIATGLLPGRLYHYRAKAKLRNKITYGADKTFWSDNKPTATTVTASGVGSRNATLNVSVNPRGATTDVTFEYGLSTGYGSGPIDGNPHTFSGSIAQPSSAAVINLFPGTTYHYRATAKNYIGSVNSADMTFTTDIIAPVVTTLAAADVSPTGATLRAEVYTNGARTEVKFYVGLDPDPDKYLFVTDSHFINQSTVSQIVTDTQGLASGMIWHYYATADNGVGGIIRGVTKSFTTE